jgi:hypothetical protein
MNEPVLRVLNPVSECPLEGVAQVQTPSLRIGHRPQSDNAEADCVAVDDSANSANPTAVIIDVQHCMARPALCGYTDIVEWSRTASVEHLPPIFGVAPVERFNQSARETGVKPEPAGVS